MKKEHRPQLLTPVMEDRIALVAYGEGSWLDKVIVHHTRKQNPRVERCYRSHIETITSIRNEMNALKCPDSLETALCEIAGREEDRPRLQGLSSLLYGMRFLVTGVAAIALAVTIANVDLNRGPSKEEIEAQLAAEQALASFAKIAEIMGRANETVVEEAIGKRAAKPISESLYKGM